MSPHRWTLVALQLVACIGSGLLTGWNGRVGTLFASIVIVSACYFSFREGMDEARHNSWRNAR